MATNSSILTWEIPWSGAWGLQSTGLQKKLAETEKTSHGVNSVLLTGNCHQMSQNMAYK